MPAPSDELELAAIGAGVIPDLSTASLSGRYEGRNAIGTDKFCAVRDGDHYAIGIFAAFGNTAHCEGQGMARATGKTVEIVLQGKGNCRFNALFDGVEIRMPGTVPESCAAYCSERASLAGVRVPLVEEGDEVARGMQGRDIALLCR